MSGDGAVQARVDHPISFVVANGAARDCRVTVIGNLVLRDI